MPDHRAALTLAEDLHAPAHARAWLGRQLPDAPQHIVDDLVLLGSELVTNAVRHGRPQVEVVLTVTAGRVRVEVYDGGSELPVVPAGPPALDRPTGRGLLIVSATATEWGVDRVEGRPGKIVWAELAAAASHWASQRTASPQGS